MTTFLIGFLLPVCLSFASLCRAQNVFGLPFTTIQPNQELQTVNYSAPSEGYLPAYVLIYPLGRLPDPPSPPVQTSPPRPPSNPPFYNHNRPVPEPYPIPQQIPTSQTTTRQSESLFSRLLSKLRFWRTNPDYVASPPQTPTVLPSTPIFTRGTPAKYFPHGTRMVPSTPTVAPRPLYTVHPETFKNPTKNPYSQPHPERVKYYQYAYVVPMMDPGSKYLYLTYYPSYVQQDKPQPQPPVTTNPTIPPLSLYVPKKPTYIVPDEPFRPINPNFKTRAVSSTTTEAATSLTTTPTTTVTTSITTLQSTVSEENKSTSTEVYDIITAPPSNETIHRARALLFNDDQDWIPLVPINA